MIQVCYYANHNLEQNRSITESKIEINSLLRVKNGLRFAFWKSFVFPFCKQDVCIMSTVYSACSELIVYSRLSKSEDKS